MSISIKSNIAAMNAQRRLGGSTAELSQSFTRLSSGLRINRAADDAAGLAIASGLNADVRTYTQGIRNINDGLSVLDVAEAALGELSNIVNRQLELAQQAANGVLTLNQRRALDIEADALTEEYNRIVQSTNFNGFQLLDRTNPSFQIQAGYGLNESITLALGDALGRDVSDGNYTIVDALNGGGSRARDAVSTDLDGDGHLDVITVSDLFSTLSVELGSGDGTFKSNTNYTTTGTSTGLAVADINGDGKLDALVIANATSTYSIFLGNGNGTFLAGTSYAPGFSSPVGANLVDVNNDGRRDLIVANTATGTVGVLLGSSDGTFGAQRTFSIGVSSLFDIALGDINNDGILDVAATSSATQSVSVLLGTGAGSFGAARSYSTNLGPNAVTLADLDDNGRLDLIYATSGTDRFEIRLGNGDGTFSAAISSNNGSDGSNHIYVSDLNGDGIPDVLQPDGGSSRFKISLGNGDGTFKAVTTITSSTQSSVAVFGDYNEDGVPEFVIMNHNGTPGNAFVSGVTQTPLMPRLNINSQADALTTLTFLREQLGRISLERGNIGAMQSRLGFAANVLEQRRQNYAEASSAITDVDVATEAAQLVRSKILQQAGAAVLAQANQAPAMALILLGSGRRR